MKGFPFEPGGLWIILASVDLERTMQFIVEQQAQITALQQKNDEQIARHSEQLS